MIQCSARKSWKLALRGTDVDVPRRGVTIQRRVIAVSGAGMVEGSTKTRAGPADG